MKDLHFIGISAIESGKQSGKTTFANMVMEEINNSPHDSFEKLEKSFNLPVAAIERSLADPLKAACKEIFGLTDQQMYGSEKESFTDWDWPVKSGKTGKMRAREILQYFGSEIMRDNWDTQVWVDRCLKYGYEIKESLYVDKFLFVFVPDVRFSNEAESMDLLIDIYRESAKEQNKDGHKSETSSKLIPKDKVYKFIENNGSLDSLREKARVFANELLDVKFE